MLKGEIIEMPIIYAVQEWYNGFYEIPMGQRFITAFTDTNIRSQLYSMQHAIIIWNENDDEIG